jgi:DNA-binding transcriptional regulator YhcF (GntR family)
MFDIQHDSPVPIHEQLIGQIRAHVATEALKAGAQLAEYRVFAQELLTNPRVVERAYEELEAEGVLRKCPSGAMEVTAGAAMTCRIRLQDLARGRMREAIALAMSYGMPESEIVKAVEQEIAAVRARPLAANYLPYAFKKASHDSSHRASQGIQDLSRKSRPGSP